MNGILRRLAAVLCVLALVFALPRPGGSGGRHLLQRL